MLIPLGRCKHADHSGGWMKINDCYFAIAASVAELRLAVSEGVSP
jgi:hypothetical protein